MKDREDMAARFAGVGLKVLAAVPAFAGLYPASGGWSTWEMLLTRHRLLARTTDGIQEWSALTGPTPGRLLQQCDLASLEVLPIRGRYDRVILAGRRLWVHRDYREVVQGWTTKNGDEQTRQSPPQ